MERIIQAQAALEGVSTLRDGGLSVRFHTQEMNAEDKSVVFGFQNRFGWLLFKDTESDFNADEIKELEAIRRDTGGKSPSQRLKAVLYVLYQQRGDTSIAFEQFYAQQIEKCIDGVKARLT